MTFNERGRENAKLSIRSPGDDRGVLGRLAFSDCLWNFGRGGLTLTEGKRQEIKETLGGRKRET